MSKVRKFDAGGDISGALLGSIGTGVSMYQTGKNLLEPYNLDFGYNDPYASIGSGLYGSTNQIRSEYDALRRSSNNRLNANDYRLNSQQRMTGITSMGMQGASLGATIGSAIAPGLGTAIGAGVGLLGGAVTGGILADEGERNMEQRVKDYNESLAIKEEQARNRLNASVDILQDRLFRESSAHAVAEGGHIERKKQSLQEFADRVLGAKKANEVTHSAGIVRSHCKGGTMVRIKVK